MLYIPESRGSLQTYFAKKGFITPSKEKHLEKPLRFHYLERRERSVSYCNMHSGTTPIAQRLHRKCGTSRIPVLHDNHDHAPMYSLSKCSVFIMIFICRAVRRNATTRCVLNLNVPTRPSWRGSAAPSV